MKHRFKKQFTLGLMLGSLWLPFMYAGGKTVNDLSETAKLLSRLDLDAPGLEKVKMSEYVYDDPSVAADALLAYYRERKSVKHPIGAREPPIDRYAKDDLLGKCAGAEDIEIADNALKHIFIGQPAYPPHFCGDDIDWSTSPVKDIEWVVQLNRMVFWDSMGRAYWHTGDEKYARGWCAQVVDWIGKNPRDRRNTHAWRSLEAGIRGYRWTGLFQRFLDSPHFTADVLVPFLNSLHDHADFLMTQYSRGSNWALMEAEGLAFIALTFPEFKDAEIWLNEAVKRLQEQIRAQVNPDGHQRELTLDYHIGAIKWFLRTYELAGRSGRRQAFPASYLQTVESMCAVVMKLGLPDGTKPQFGDDWSGKPGHLWPLLRHYANLFERDDFLYVATQGREGVKPRATAFALEKSGLYSMRSGWDANAVCLVLKCGPDGGWHCQPDNGTFVLYAGGRTLMPDSGCYIYSGDPESREWFRATRNHQTLTLNGGNSAFAPKLLLWKPGNDGEHDLLVVENAGYKNLTHRRAIWFVDKKYFVIVDDAFGEATGEIYLHFQLAPGNAVFDHEAFSVRTDFSEGWNVLVRGVEQQGMTLEEQEGKVSFAYNKKEPRPAFRYRIRKDTPETGVRFVTLVAPYGAAPPDISIAIKGQPAIGGGRLDLEVPAHGRSRIIGYNLEGQ